MHSCKKYPSYVNIFLILEFLYHLLCYSTNNNVHTIFVRSKLSIWIQLIFLTRYLFFHKNIRIFFPFRQRKVREEDRRRK